MSIEGKAESVPRRSLLAIVGRPFMASVGKAGYPAGDSEVAFRVQVVVLYAATSGLVAMGYALSHWAHAALGLALLFVLFAGLTFAQLLLLRWTGRLRLVAHGTLAVAMVSTSVATCFTGGLRMTNICPFFIMIVAAIFLLSWEGLPWALLSVVVPGAFEVATALGVSFPDYVPPAERAADALLTWLVGIIVVFLFVVCYEAARLLSLRRRIEAEEARSQFLANVSHELRTPLHAIMGMTSHVLRGDLQDDARDSLKTSLHNADALLSLISDLLDLASLQRDRFALHQQDFDPAGVVERVARVARFRCEEQGLVFAFDIAESLPRWVRGDGDRLQQVLMNLATNAVKYTTEGSVELSAQMDRPDGDVLWCRFSVRDTGIGISEGDRDSLFDPYTQGAGSPGRFTGGTGLGLGIVRDIVSAMGGRVDLESERGAGSTFHVVIPYEPARSEAPESESVSEQPPSSRAGRQVLLVDDDRVNLKMATIMLEDLKHQVQVARDGHEAIAEWREQHPDLILMDLQMPGMDGLEAIRRIRDEEQESDREPVAIVALTGHGTREHRDRCLTAGADQCLFKPFRLEDLRDTIASLEPPTST